MKHEEVEVPRFVQSAISAAGKRHSGKRKRRHLCPMQYWLLAALASFILGASMFAWSEVAAADESSPVSSLPFSDKVRMAGRPIGSLSVISSSGSIFKCTAALISKVHIITPLYCINDAVSAELTLGLVTTEPPTGKKFEVTLPPVSSDAKLGYAVLEVGGEPDKEFGVANLLVRIPIEGEKVFIIFHGQAAVQLFAADCRVVSANDTPLDTGPIPGATVVHDCETQAGSGGAFLFSETDNAVLGIHMLRNPVGNQIRLARAVPMYSIALSDPVVRSIAAVRPTTIDFRTRNRDFSSVGVDILKLYLTLHNSLRLPLRPRQVDDFKNIEDVYRQFGLFYGEPFPEQLDSLACDLNPNVCSRQLIPASETELASLTGHVSRFKSSVGTWTVPPGTSLFLPDIPFERGQDWINYKKTKNTSLAKIVEKDLGGCVKFDEQCKKLIATINRMDDDRKFRDDYAGLLILPVASITAMNVDISSGPERSSSRSEKITVSSPHDDRSTILERKEALDSRLSNKSAVSVDDSLRAVKLPSDPAKAAGAALGSVKMDLDTVVRTLGSTAAGKISIKPFAVPETPRCGGDEQRECELKNEDFEIYRSRLLKGLSFPFEKIDAYPDEIKTGTSAVAIIDTQADLQHCAFQALRDKNKIRHIGDMGRLANYPAPIAPCEWMMPKGKLDVAASHGTHVAGIIAGDFKGLMSGLNPYATLYTGHIPLTGTSDSEEVKLEELNTLLKRMLTEAGNAGVRIDVVNFSFYYRRQPLPNSESGGQRVIGDPVLRTIRTFGANTLFVVAAGNDEEEFSAICDSRPSCFDLPNVISVGALDSSSKDAILLSLPQAKGSNFGRRVHVAAPGRDILSAISGNYFGVMSGTSQATPQVAAVASLLRAGNKHLTPSEVKERLIICSTSVPVSTEGDLETSTVVFGGHIDASCTLQKNGWLELKDTPGVMIPVTEVSNTATDLSFAPAGRDSKIALNPRAIRGIRFNPDDSTFTVFHRRPGDERDAELLREERVELPGDLDQKLNLRVQLPGKPPKLMSYSLSNVARFVVPLRKP
ncbi:subtilisin family serine protease [Bradyrhizobium sp. RT4a]